MSAGSTASASLRHGPGRRGPPLSSRPSWACVDGLPGRLRPARRLMAHMLASGSWVGWPATLSVVTALGFILAAAAGVWVLLVAGPRYRLRYGPLFSQQLPNGSWEVDIY